MSDPSLPDVKSPEALRNAAKVIAYGVNWGESDESERSAAETIARALADAGLLNTRHGEA